VHEVGGHSYGNARWDSVFAVLEGNIGRDSGKAVHHPIGQTKCGQGGLKAD
jgi:hypothetical protein